MRNSLILFLMGMYFGGGFGFVLLVQFRRVLPVSLQDWIDDLEERWGQLSHSQPDKSLFLDDDNS